MQSLVGYQLADSVATITVDDGKVNVLSLRAITEINQALDRALDDAAVVVLAGRPGVFSAGFDLPVIRAGGPAATSMLRAGFDLAERVLSYPRPVVIACTGHAVAMGAFLLLSGDYRVGAAGPYKITANEVAIGLTMPRAAVEICRQRLTPAHFWDTVHGITQHLGGLDQDAHKATKLRARKAALVAVHDAIAADNADLAQREQAAATVQAR